MLDADCAHLDIAGVGKRFRQTTVLDGITLGVARGEFVSLLGPSGCGKTTLLRILAGLLAADHGRITLGGQDLSRRTGATSAWCSRATRCSPT